jgi:hypothetical protein
MHGTYLRVADASTPSSLIVFVDDLAACSVEDGDGSDYGEVSPRAKHLHQGSTRDTGWQMLPPAMVRRRRWLLLGSASRASSFGIQLASDGFAHDPDVPPFVFGTRSCLAHQQAPNIYSTAP